MADQQSQNPKNVINTKSSSQRKARETDINRSMSLGYFEFVGRKQRSQQFNLKK